MEADRSLAPLQSRYGKMNFGEMQVEHDDIEEEFDLLEGNQENQMNAKDTEDMDTSTANNENTHHMTEFRNTLTPGDQNNNNKSYTPSDESKMYKKQYFTASIKMPTVGSEVNVAARLRWFWTILKKIDEDMAFIPHDEIDGEEKLIQIPDEELSIKKYFKNIRDEKNMLKCGFQGTYKVDEWKFKQKMFKVMGEYNCLLKLEELGTSEVYEVGWFHGIHPKLTNKKDFLTNVNNLMKEKLEEKLFEYEDLKDVNVEYLRISYYSRKIFGTRHRMGESMKGVVVEVKEVRKDLTINLLMEVLQE
jgi:hypothetical protein